LARLLSLVDPAAGDPSLVGHKAAGLALALARGYPVLPGLVVPVPASEAAVASGLAALGERGRGAARAAALAARPDPALLAELGAAALGERLVVRSSTRLGDDGTWSGAYASYGDVMPAELGTAVSGCWASIFAPATLDRLAQAGTGPGEVGMAVLVQPFLEPRAGGWASLRPDGTLTIAAVGGHPGPLLAGWIGGSRLVVRPGKRVRQPAFPLGTAEVARLADLVRRVASELAARHIEWAFDGERLFVLQLARGATEEPLPRFTGRSPAARPSSSLAHSSRRKAFAARPYARLLQTLVDRRGPLADAFLLPWAAAAEPVEAAVVTAPDEALLQRSGELAAALSAQVCAAVGHDRTAISDALVAGDRSVINALARMSLDASMAAELLGCIDALGTAFHRRGLLGDPRTIWWQTSDWIEAAALGRPCLRPANDRPLDLWGDVLYAAVVAQGAPAAAVGVADGRTVGRALRVDAPDAAGERVLGRVLVVRDPVSSVAPLLWRASGLLSLSGGPGAHLFEVARSLHVPAVVAPEAGDITDGTIVAVDGSAGELWVRRGEPMVAGEAPVAL